MLQGTVQVGVNLAMKVAEVNIQEWIIFIVDNHYDSTLFPNNTLLSKPAQLLFLDLKKEKDFEYLKISKKKHHDDLGEIETVTQTSRLTKLCEEDFKEFSISTSITGITYDQATRYCDWLENLVNQRRQIDIVISLPTVSMYESVITNLDSLNNKGCALYNFIHCSCVSQTKIDYNQSLGKSLVHSAAFFPTALGLYTLQGNAAEMTNMEGIAKGGSFKHYAKDSFSDQVQNYSGAEEWLGFRYIVIISTSAIARSHHQL
jgi:hypothetical protein